ncbi:MAG TPA: carboxypeptidase regulatory-like domain-containing protein [Blastocatellia bacterium]|nr:carboxypeptidase regulatory-like domain-containing protein [Blastocatellia bacterium]
MTRFGISKIALAVVICSALGVAALGQTAQITGRVSDQSGAVIQGARVTITNEGNGFKRETLSNDEGYFTVPSLQPGMYRISIQKEGFKPILQTGRVLQVEQVVRLDFTLQTGAVTEVLEVQAGAVALDSETSSIGQVVTQRQVTQLPLNGRNFLQLMFLNGGTVETEGEQGTMRRGAGSAISINGSRPTSNNYLLDGTSNTDTALGTPAVILSVDAIQEFKEQTSTYSAEFGFSANQINIVSKTGTNDLHGTAFWFGRNDALDANNYFNNLTGTPKSKLRQNQFGFVAGGPVRIPRLYNGRDRTFWLVNYEGARIRRGELTFNNVPTPDQLAGRFTTSIIDPLTGAPFPNNTIPQERFSRLANLARARFFPVPNSSVPQGNYVLNRTLPNDTNQLTIRGDQNLGKWGTVFGRFTKADFDITGANGVSPVGDTFFIQRSRNWQLSHSWPIGNKLVNQFRFGRVDATVNQNGVPADRAEISALGLTGVFTDTMSDLQRGYPGIAFSAGGLSRAGGAVNDYTTSNQPMWDLSNTTTWIRGSHTLNIGANYRQWQFNRDLVADLLGDFTFGGSFTGNPVADFLLGYYSRASVFQPAALSNPNVAGNPRQYNFKYFAPYLQDDWKVNRRLTLNLGVRWDFRTAPYETNNHFGWLDGSNPRGGMLVADRRLLDEGFVGDGGFYRYAGRRNPADAPKRVFAPRFGFAFRPFEKTVIRGGYGLFYDSAEGREIDGSADIYPYVSRGDYKQSITSPSLQTTDALFPVFTGPVTPAANSFIAVISSATPEYPYVQQWSLSVQREIFKDTTLEVNYIGNKGTHLLMRRNIAQSMPVDPGIPLDDPRNSVEARRPYPNFVTYIDSDWSGNSIYNAMNVKFERRTSTLAMMAVYTWAKSLDSKSAAAGIGGQAFNGWQGFLNNHDPKRDRGRSDFDVDQRLIASFVYDLPIGRGKRFGNGLNRAADAILGGWQVNGIATFQRGFPISITAADSGNLLDSAGTNRGDLVGNPKSGRTGVVDSWFNKAAFAQPAPGAFGSSGRNILRAPGVHNFDLSLFKNFTISERVRLQFRLESFNAFNHTQFDDLEVNVTAPQFGQILSARPARINQLGAKLIW